MNRLILLLLFLFRALINFAQTENNCDTCFYDQYSLRVVIKNTAISTENKILQNSTLRQLLKEDTLIQCFPYSKNEYLKRVYRIKSKSNNASQLMNDLLNSTEVEHVLNH